MLLYCPLFSETRIHEYKVLRDIVINHIGAEAWTVYFSRKEDITQLIIDSRRFSNLLGDTDIIYKIEKLSRNLCYNYTIKDYPSFVKWNMAARVVTPNLLYPKVLSKRTKYALRLLTDSYPGHRGAPIQRRLIQIRSCFYVHRYI